MRRAGSRLGVARVFAGLTLALACSDAETVPGSGPLTAEEIDRHEGAVCGMLVRGQSAPRAQVVHRDGERAFVCSIGDLLAYLAAPSPHGAPKGVFVEVMAPDEDPTEAHLGPHPWIRAEQAVFVVGVKRRGIMGPPVLVYRTPADAQRVAQQSDAEILDFESLKAWYAKR